MTPQDAIDALDDALKAAGEEVVLRRIVGLLPNIAKVDVKCRAFVRAWRLREEELVSGIDQAVVLVTLSPSEIARAKWPGGELPVAGVAPSLPRRLDYVIVKNRLRSIQAVEPLFIAGVLVRIDMQVLG